MAAGTAVPPDFRSDYNTKSQKVSDFDLVVDRDVSIAISRMKYRAEPERSGDGPQANGATCLALPVPRFLLSARSLKRPSFRPSCLRPVRLSNPE